MEAEPTLETAIREARGLLWANWPPVHNLPDAEKRHHQFFRRRGGVAAQRHIFCIRASRNQACTRGSLSDRSTGDYQPVVDL